MRRKPILSRDDAERVADRIQRDCRALFDAVGGVETPIRRDEIIPIHELSGQAERV